MAKRKLDMSDDQEADITPVHPDSDEVIIDEPDFVEEPAGEDESEPEENFVSTEEFVRQRLESRIEELELKLQQTYAAHRGQEEELRKIRERLERDREKQLFREKAKLFGQLLEPLDNLERSLNAADLSGDPQALLEGVQLVHTGIERSFGAAGLKKFGTPGDRFDPELHEALSIVSVDDPAENDRIHTVYLAGYTLNGEVIRPARVVVCKVR